VIGFSHFMVETWYLQLALLMRRGVRFRAWIATARGKYAWDRFKLKIPIAGKSC